jgi:hypothetical protein
LRDGDAGSGEAVLVLSEQFGQDVANPLRLTATLVLETGNTVFHDISP